MPLKRPTTTPVPDEIFDEWLSVLSHAEMRVLLYIVRRTFGFGKRGGDSISFTQFLKGITTRDGRVLDKGCGVRNRTNLSHALMSLETRGLIRSYKGRDPPGDKAVTVYALRFEGIEQPGHDPREPPSPMPVTGAIGGGTTVVPPRTATVPRGSTATVPPVVPQRYRQETEPQQTARQQTGGAPPPAAPPAYAQMRGEKRDTPPAPAIDAAALALWQAVLDEVRPGMTDDNYEQWFASTRVGGWDGKRLQIVVSSDFHRRWLDGRLRRHIKHALTTLGRADTPVVFVVDSS